MLELASKKGWSRVAFGDVVRLSRERTRDPESDGLERYVGLEHIDPGALSIRRWGNIADGTTFTNVFRAGQVLFGKRRAYQRKVAVADFDGVCSGDIYVLESKNERLLPDLLPHICQTDSFFEHAVATSAGSLSPRTNWESLARYEFALPRLEEQRRLTSVLAGTERATESLRDLRSRVEGLRDPLSTRLLWGDHAPAGRSGSRETTDFSSGQKIRRLGDVVTFQGGSQPPRSTFVFKPSEGYVRLLQIRDYKSEDYCTFIPRSSARRFCRADDIMIGRYGPPLFQILRGLEGAYNVALIKAVPDEDVLMKEYLYHFLRERRLHDLIDHLSARSAGQAGVEMSVLVNYPIPVPQLSVQKEIAATLGEIDAQITAIDTRVATMQRLRNSLVSAVLGREAS